MGHRLVFYANRSTPQVVGEGGSAKSKEGYGKVTHSRPANADEEKTIARGGWVRVDSKGNKPSSASYKASSYRPKLGEKRRATNKRIAKMFGASNIVRNTAKPMNAAPKPPKPMAGPNGFQKPKSLLPMNAQPKQMAQQMKNQTQKLNSAPKQDVFDNGMKTYRQAQAGYANKERGETLKTGIKTKTGFTSPVSKKEKMPEKYAAALPSSTVRAYDKSTKNKKHAAASTFAAKLGGGALGAAAGYGVYRAGKGKIKNATVIKVPGKKRLVHISAEKKQGMASSAASSLGGSIGGYIGSRKSLDKVKSDRKYGYRDN
jgi:hypothetical protein